MLVLRPVKASDADALYALAQQAGVGVTTLPADRVALADKIAQSEQAFQIKKPNAKESALYFFVLEDLDTQTIVGTSAIDAFVGGSIPFYSYKLSRVTQINHDLDISREHEVLSLTNDYQHQTEICSLFLASDYRRKRYGHLLSCSRFLFMAQYPQRFAETIFAEMRGVSDQHGHSPFWQSLGQHFFCMDFPTADRLTITTNKQFIADLMPQKPIYLCLLHPAAQAVIGKAHDATQPAVKMLEREGFINKDYVDIFDAGPVLETRLEHIRTARESQIYEVAQLAEMAESQQGLIANTQLDFRACCAAHHIISDTQVALPAQVAAALNLQVGDQVRIGPL